MMLRWLPIILCLLPAPAALAEEANPFTNDGAVAEPAPRARLKPDAIRITVSEADCRRLTIHELAPDVTYRPGVDVRGKSVAPADLPGSTALADKIRETDIAFDLKLNPLLFAGNPALADLFDEAVVDFGRVRLDRGTGQLTLDGEPLTDPQQAAIVAACRARLD